MPKTKITIQVTINAPVTSKKFAKEYPFNVSLLKEDSNLKLDSTVLLNQIKTIDKTRIIKRISNLDDDLMRKINLAIKVSLGIN